MTADEALEVRVRCVALTVLAVAAGMYVLSWAREVFIPIALSILMSYALEPIVAWLTRWRVARGVAAACVVGSLTGAAGYAGYAFADDAAAIAAELPEAAQRLRRVLRQSSSGTLQQVQQAADELQRTANETAGASPAPRGVQRVQVETPPFNVRDYLSWGSAGMAAFAGQAVLIVFFVFFLLASGDLFKRKLVKLAGPSLAKQKVALRILDEINLQIGTFLLVRVATSLVVGVASWMAFRLVGLEQAGLWGIAAGVFNSVPYVGPVIVAAGIFVVAFLQFETLSMAGSVAGLSLVITSVEGWLLTPWLTSRTSRSNEVAVFVSLIFWSFVWGIWGALLAVPMLVALKAYCDRIDALRPFGELLGEEAHRT